MISLLKILYLIFVFKFMGCLLPQSLQFFSKKMILKKEIYHSVYVCFGPPRISPEQTIGATFNAATLTHLSC